MSKSSKRWWLGFGEPGPKALQKWGYILSQVAVAHDGRLGIWAVLLSLPALISLEKSLCFEERAFHQTFYVHPAVTSLLKAAPLLEAFSELMVLPFSCY